MREITLNFPGDSYEKISYPGGETQIRLKPWLVQQNPLGEVKLLARLTEQSQIMDLCLLVDALENWGAKIYLCLPYLPYARADRRFVAGDTFGLEVFAKILNALPVKKISTIDAHSPEALKCIPGLVNISAEPFIKQAVLEFSRRHPSDVVKVLFPDSGAALRYGGMLDAVIGNNLRTTWVRADYCSKVRNPATGELSHFVVPEVSPYDPVLIVDDICDGGRTFSGIVSALRHRGFEGAAGLYVTHGIFSNESNLTIFDDIFVTDSFRVTYNTQLPLTVFSCVDALTLAGKTLEEE